MSNIVEWGLYTGNRSPFSANTKVVHGAFKHGLALFVADQRWSTLTVWYEGVIAGHPDCQIGGYTEEEAKANVELWASRMPPVLDIEKFVSFEHMKEFVS